MVDSLVEPWTRRVRPSLSVWRAEKNTRGPLFFLCYILKSSFNSAKSLKRDTRSLLTLFACAILRSCSSGKSAPCRTTSTPTPPTRPTTCSKYSISLFLVHRHAPSPMAPRASRRPGRRLCAAAIDDRPGVVPNSFLLLLLLFLHLSPVVASPAGRQTKCCITACLLLIPSITSAAVLCLARNDGPLLPLPASHPPGPHLEGAFSYTMHSSMPCRDDSPPPPASLLTGVPRTVTILTRPICVATSSSAWSFPTAPSPTWLRSSNTTQRQSSRP